MTADFLMGWWVLVAAFLALVFYLTLWWSPAPAPARGGGSGGGSGGGAGDPKWRGELSREDVAKHADEEDCWIIVDGAVYDISDYVTNHPGGDAILRYAGDDSTAGVYGDQHPVDKVMKLLAQFKIGKLKD